MIDIEQALDRLVETCGAPRIVEALAYVCIERGKRAAEVWQDARQGKAWVVAGAALEAVYVRLQGQIFINGPPAPIRFDNDDDDGE
ncbi:MAG TPA: hypothetical protein VGF39_09575 [Stellaceae bacterium]|jgi:hypothetical protein